jgi:hypothetical protein
MRNIVIRRDRYVAAHHFSSSINHTLTSHNIFYWCGEAPFYSWHDVYDHKNPTYGTHFELNPYKQTDIRTSRRVVLSWHECSHFAFRAHSHSDLHFILSVENVEKRDLFLEHMRQFSAPNFQSWCLFACFAVEHAFFFNRQKIYDYAVTRAVME